ncbi:molybdopterin molybdotransferase MoeA [Galbibacter sp.]|uniref:molybdopterin molybdotransferase MoeA n=1 Tax=Galbibacter sp. TaxID=2918471 RepID=UPI003A9160F7
MIPYKEAFEIVQSHKQDYGVEKVPFTRSLGRVLAEDIKADRDFPAFDRATKDGIALCFDGMHGQSELTIAAVVAAGTPQISLRDKTQCVEIMTGAVVPQGADTVVMYEDIQITDGIASLQTKIRKGQNIHHRASDRAQGEVVIPKSTTISAAEIGILAAVGSVQLMVKKLPEICLVSTGNELVAVHETPLAHQIRESNMHTLHALLEQEKIPAKHHHFDDDKESIINALDTLLSTNNVLMLSGGVSKGKFDYIPDAMEHLGVKKCFHRVKQKPGKPFWFGIYPKTNTLVFSFPGNPVSTFVNYHLYFKTWLHHSLEIKQALHQAVLGQSIFNEIPLTVFKNVYLKVENGVNTVYLVQENGSGDLISMVQTDGFIVLPPQSDVLEKGDVIDYVPTRL